MSKYQFVWKGHESRPVGVMRPCSCGCDSRDGYKGVGYLTGSDAQGNGFTVWIESEEVYEKLEELIGESHA